MWPRLFLLTVTFFMSLLLGVKTLVGRRARGPQVYDGQILDGKAAQWKYDSGNIDPILMESMRLPIAM